MENYNMPMKMETHEDEEYIVEHNENGEYDEDELLSPNGQVESDWGNLRDSAGGKLRLKRRRKCGQCGPCQVKENCDKCHFCLRRDVLKQSCIYRKCLYLRKKQSRVRECVPNSRHPSSSQSPSAALASACVSPTTPNSSTPLSPAGGDVSHCRLPQPSASFIPTNNHHHLTPDAHRALMSVDPLPGFPPDSLRHLPIPPPPDPLRNYQSPPQSESHRSHSADHARSPHTDMRPMSSDTVRSLPTSQAPPTTPSSIDHIRSPPSSDHSSRIRSFPDQLRAPLGMEGLRGFPAEQYAMAYGPPRHVWPPPGMPSPYNFPAHNMNMAASSSCRMTLPEACRYSMPTQPSFPHHAHHHMPFNLNADFRPPVPFGSPSSIGPTMNPPFYPPPPVPPVASTSLPTLPIGQYSAASQESFGASRFAAPHPSMYHGSLYSPFRAPNEPYIYSALFPPPSSVFTNSAYKMDFFRDTFLRTGIKSEFSKDTDMYSNIFDDKAMMQEKYKRLEEESLPTRDSLKDASLYSQYKNYDDDLQQEMDKVSRERPCNVCISIDDHKMQAFIRSDGVNNLEIEIESPFGLSFSANIKEPKIKIAKKDLQDTSNYIKNTTKTKKESTVLKQSKLTGKLTGMVCVKQDLGDEGILVLEVPGHRVSLEETVLDSSLLMQSSQPEELIEFLKTPLSVTSSDQLEDCDADSAVDHVPHQ